MTVSSVLPVLRDALLDEGAAGAESITEWHLRCLAAYLRGGSSSSSRLLSDLRAGSLDACHAKALFYGPVALALVVVAAEADRDRDALPHRDHT